MNKTLKRSAAIGAACALGLGIVALPQAATAAPIDVEPTTTAVVNLLHINDFHGRVASPGTVNFAGLVEDLRLDYPSASLLTGGGDLIGASNFTSGSQQDVPAIDVLNALGLDASAVGNHEFDQGVDDLTERVVPLAEWTYLSANVTLDGAPIGPAYATYEIDGITVGVVGAVTDETPSLVAPSGIVGVEFAPVAESINRVAAELSDGDPSNGEADIVVAELHEHGLATPDAFSADVDVVFNGHTHQAYAELRTVPGTDVQRPFVQSGEYAGHVGQVVLAVDRETLAIDPRVVTNHATPETDGSAYIAKYPSVAEIAQIVGDAEDAAAVAGNVQVGTIAADITVPAQNRSNRAEESTMAALVANMYRDQVAPENRGGAEIGIVNPGGLRDNLLYARTAEAGEEVDGIVRLAEANAVLPFINNLGSMTLTGAQLDQVLEEQWQRDASGSTEGLDRPYLQLGLSDNVTYVSDPTREIDDRVSDIAIDGVRITPEQQIRVASSTFLLDGGDNFWTFQAGADRTDSGLVDLDAFTAYLADNPEVAPSWAVNHVDITGLPAEPVAEGDEVTVEVAQLDRIRSTGAVASSTVEVLDADGEVVGSGAVVVNEDESGAPLTTSATVTFTASLVDGAAAVPVAEPVAASYAIRADNGTLIPFQLLVTPAPAATEPPVETPVPTETTDPTTPAPAPTDDDGAQAGGGSLPRTGGEVSPMLWIGAGALLLVGAALVIGGRLRRTV